MKKIFKESLFGESRVNDTFTVRQLGRVAAKALKSTSLDLLCAAPLDLTILYLNHGDNDSYLTGSKNCKA